MFLNINVIQLSPKVHADHSNVCCAKRSLFFVFLFFAPAFGIVGIVVSAIGLGVRRSYRRSGTAVAGLVLGILFTALSLAALVLLVANGYAA